MSWRILAWFWAAIVLILAVGAATLELLGPPAQPEKATTTPPAAAPRRVVANRSPAIAPPDPALLEPSKTDAPAMLPRVAADGRMPRQVYAGSFDRADTRPRIALVMAGIGTAEADSRAAMEALPPAIDLAVSPYAGNPESLLPEARARGHELLLSIPMEPAGYPLNDAGSQSLMTGLDAAANRVRLDWALSRIQGYAGATAALDGMRGENFADRAAALGPVLQDLGRRGLFYVDPRPGLGGAVAGVPSRTVDLVVDDPPARAEVEAKLAGLERIARDKGSALGLAGPPRAMTVERIAAWAKTLDGRGIALVPVSALTVGGTK